MTLNLLKAVIDDFLGGYAEVNDNSYLMRDLEIVGDDYDDLLRDFFDRSGVTPTQQEFTRLLKLVPSEAYAIFGFSFKKVPDTTVAQLAKELDRCASAREV